MKLADHRFAYRDDRFPFGSDCACRLRVWGGIPFNVVIATELQDAPGASVTNTIETIAAEVVKTFDLIPELTLFVEHYQHRGIELRETFDCVHFTWRDGVATKPTWKPTTKKKIETIIREAL